MKISSRPGKLAFALLSILACVLCIRSAWGAGLSSLLARRAKIVFSLEQADSAVRLDPSNPEAHSARAIVLLNQNRWDMAVAEFEEAARLRPRDYMVWLELGRARDTAGDRAGGLLALRESVRLAPSYSKPGWQYGNLLLRAGKVEEAFAEMRRAAAGDPSLYPVLVDLAWGTFQGNVEALKRAVEPQTPAANLLVARLLIRKAKVSEGMEFFRAAGGLAKEEEVSRLLRELLAARRYREAYEVWSRSVNVAPAVGGIIEPGFEGSINLKDVGFGWQQAQDIVGVKISVDAFEPKEGARSLHLEWTGNSNPAAPVLTQIVPVEPGASYRLRFAARTKELVTGGLPLIVLTDASSADERVLARTTPLPQTTDGGWRQYEVEFKAGEKTEAVVIRLQRENCTSAPCPIFGRIWLDDFILEKSGQVRSVK